MTKVEKGRIKYRMCLAGVSVELLHDSCVETGIMALVFLG